MKTVKYAPKKGYMVPNWRIGEQREVTNDVAAQLLDTGHFEDITPKPAPKPKKKTESEAE